MLAQPPSMLEVTHIGDRVSVLRLHGNLTLDSETALTETYAHAIPETVRAIVLDFTQLDFMNSGGIGLLVTLLVRANRRKQTVLAFGLSDHYREIFDLTRLAEAIRVYDDEESALAAAQQEQPA
jgi:anti-sigma B factor antagonist